MATVKTKTELGYIILNLVGAKVCMEGYGTTDPWHVGRLALEFGDIRLDGELN